MSLTLSRHFVCRPFLLIRRSLSHAHPSVRAKPQHALPTFPLHQNRQAASQLHLKSISGEVPKDRVAIVERKFQSFYRSRSNNPTFAEKIMCSNFPKIVSKDRLSDEKVDLKAFDQMIEGISEVSEEVEQKLNALLFSEEGKVMLAATTSREQIFHKLMGIKAYDFIVELIESLSMASNREVEVYVLAQLESRYANPHNAKVLVDWLSEIAPNDRGTLFAQIKVSRVFLHTLKNYIDQIEHLQKSTQIFQEFKFCYPHLNTNSREVLQRIYNEQFEDYGNILNRLRPEEM